MKGAATLVAACLLGLFVPVSARAQDTRAEDALDRCVQAATGALEADGARAVGTPVIGFLHEGDALVDRVVLEEGGCMGWLAFGHERVQDLDLRLYTAGGIALELDTRDDARPYVRFCGAEGLELVVSAQMYAGRGEIRLLRFADAPASLPDLNRTVGACFATAGGMRRPSGEIGEEPPGRALDAALEAVDASLGRIGYRPRATEPPRELEPRGRQLHALTVDAGACYAVAAVGDAGVADLDLFVRDPSGAEVDRDASRESNAVVRFCASRGSDYVAEVRIFVGAGSYVLRTYRLDEPPPDARPLGVRGQARIGYAEATAELGHRGMEAEPLAWGFIAPGQDLRMPVRLEAGRCYGFAGVSSGELRAGDLDLVLLDEEDGLVARDLARGSTPLVFHCAERTGVYQLVGHVYGARGRYLALVATDEESP